jgi:GNAT superfamily N-acetyltransferase
MSISIRQVKPEDARTLSEILHKIGWFSQVEKESVEETTQRLIQQITLMLSQPDMHDVFVAETNENEVVGYVSVHYYPYLFMTGPEGYLSELFVDTDVRSLGVGSALLNAAQAAGEKRGCTRLSLLNYRQRESYKREYYKKHGWEERPDMANFVYTFKK